MACMTHLTSASSTRMPLIQAHSIPQCMQVCKHQEGDEGTPQTLWMPVKLALMSAGGFHFIHLLSPHCIAQRSQLTYGQGSWQSNICAVKHSV